MIHVIYVEMGTYITFDGANNSVPYGVDLITKFRLTRNNRCDTPK